MPCNKAIFILSLDCEGKWGMADHLNAYHHTHFTTANIEKAYADILAPLKEYNIAASFAFVTAFTQSIAQFRQHKDLFYNTPQSYKHWMEAFYRDMEQQRYEGWFCPSALAQVLDAGLHDVGSHSCFHRSFNENELTLEEAEYDFRAAQELLSCIPKTFIYPRNIIGFTGLLQKYGYVGYRHGNAYQTSVLGRLKNLAAEFNITTPSEPPMAQGIVPAGYFLNRPHGMRKIVPDEITKLRWKRIIEHAIAHKQVAHMWFHPHNFINHPRMAQNFAQIMRMVADYRDAGKLEVMTMQEYLCR